MIAYVFEQCHGIAIQEITLRKAKIAYKAYKHESAISATKHRISNTHGAHMVQETDHVKSHHSKSLTLSRSFRV